MSVKREAEQILDQHLKSMKVVKKELPPDFSQNLHRKLVEASFQKTPQPKSLFYKFFVRPLVFGSFAAIFLTAGIFIGKQISSSQNLQNDQIAQNIQKDNASAPIISQSATVKSGEPVTIRLVYNSQKKIEKVNFTIMLENGLQFVSKDPEIASVQILKWEGSLTEGKNEIPFVVSAQQSGEMIVNAVAEYDGGKQRQLIKLIVSKETGNISIVPQKEENHV